MGREEDPLEAVARLRAEVQRDLEQDEEQPRTAFLELFDTLPSPRPDSDVAASPEANWGDSHSSESERPKKTKKQIEQENVALLSRTQKLMRQNDLYLPNRPSQEQKQTSEAPTVVQTLLAKLSFKKIEMTSKHPIKNPTFFRHTKIEDFEIDLDDLSSDCNIHTSLEFLNDTREPVETLELYEVPENSSHSETNLAAEQIIEETRNLREDANEMIVNSPVTMGNIADDLSVESGELDQVRNVSAQKSLVTVDPIHILKVQVDSLSDNSEEQRAFPVEILSEKDDVFPGHVSESEDMIETSIRRRRRLTLDDEQNEKTYLSSQIGTNDSVDKLDQRQNEQDSDSEEQVLLSENERASPDLGALMLIDDEAEEGSDFEGRTHQRSKLLKRRHDSEDDQQVETADLSDLERLIDDEYEETNGETIQQALHQQLMEEEDLKIIQRIKERYIIQPKQRVEQSTDEKPNIEDEELRETRELAETKKAMLEFWSWI